ncbi:M1 family metallopeptidase [Nocardioides pantholopis]|uniref:M1 family metallopeptidase n=1 Tax=Nocardioides pantholopis TaxID=2483798 RepID=UPI000F089E2B|nr:M1 family metallopeptidase [Nocardioides pantholopis]
MTPLPPARRTARRSTHRAVVAGLLCLGLLAGCSGEDAEPTAKPTAAPSADPDGAGSSAPATDLDVALSEPVEDPLYPEVGDPGVDALHYDLALDWDPESSTLTGVEELTFRATADAAEVRLDLGAPLDVSRVALDGEEVEFAHEDKDLVVAAEVTAEDRHLLTVEYAGTPEPVSAPTSRTDFTETGWTITEDGETWTMQEPFGAYSWYAVNDHPSDKALYDITLTVPSPWVGVANGELTSRTEEDGRTRTSWHLAEPAASYLVTVATGEFTMTEDTSAAGVPLTYWTPAGDERTLRRVRRTGAALDWVSERLGPYPYDTLGVVVVDSESGMETQTMITLGDTAYTTSTPVLVHEVAHHWYGNQVSPRDWFDVWMNEGMAMYLQGVWEAEESGRTVEAVMDEWAVWERDWRTAAGPPAAFDADSFGASNIYYGPALMWHELRERLGDQEFWAMVRAWPATRDNGNAGTEEYLAWIQEQTGEDLAGFFDAWLLGEDTPPRD